MNARQRHDREVPLPDILHRSREFENFINYNMTLHVE